VAINIHLFIYLFKKEADEKIYLEERGGRSL
jgi:hypothetical protein